MQNTYGTEAVNRSNVFRWYSQFWDGRELVEDDESGGHPKLTWTEVNIAAVADLVKNDRRIASRMIAESLNIPKTVVLRILKEDLGKRMLGAHFVPQFLTCLLTKLQVFSSFWPKKCYNRLSPPVIQIYLHQTIFCSPSWKWNEKDSTLWMLLRSKSHNWWIKGPKRNFL
jgi:hypothetical protein